MAAFKAWTYNIPWFGSIGLRAACTHCIYIPVTSDRWQPWQLKRTSTIEASLINMEPSSGFLPALSNEQRRLWLPKSQPATVVIGRMLAATVAIGRMLKPVAIGGMLAEQRLACRHISSCRIRRKQCCKSHMAMSNPASFKGHSQDAAAMRSSGGMAVAESKHAKSAMNAIADLLG